MHSPDFPTNLTNNNPLSQSVFVRTYDEAIIAPGNPKFIVTEDSEKITTENDIFLITES